jgi:hypothetical protein
MKKSSSSRLLVSAALLLLGVDGFSSNSLPTTTPTLAVHSSSDSALFSSRFQQEQQYRTSREQQSVFERERERKWAAAQAAARQGGRGPQSSWEQQQQYTQPNRGQLTRYRPQGQQQQQQNNQQLTRYPAQQQQYTRQRQQFMPQGRGSIEWGLLASAGDWLEQAKWTLKNSFSLNNNSMMMNRNSRHNQQHWSPTPQYYGPGGGAANRAPLPQTGPQNRLLFDDPRYSNPTRGSSSSSSRSRSQQQWSPTPPITASSLSRTWFDASPAQAAQNYYIYERPVTNKSWSPQVQQQNLSWLEQQERGATGSRNNRNWFTSFESLDEKLLKQRKRFDYSQVPASQVPASVDEYWTTPTNNTPNTQKYAGLEPSSFNYQKRKNWNPLGGGGGGGRRRDTNVNAEISRLERRVQEMEKRQKQQQQQQQQRSTSRGGGDYRQQQQQYY